MIQFEEFTGGPLDTNAFLIHSPGGNILIDAPMGADRRFQNTEIHTLILTHGHFDHIADAAAIQSRHGCRVGFHPGTLPMVSDRNFFRKWGFELEVEPVAGELMLAEPATLDSEGAHFHILDVPGHCPGSICLYIQKSGLLFGGDVLFRNGIGRWDLPGGDYELLVTGIRNKILVLPDSTRVLPGHGPETTVGTERKSNPWLQH